MIISRKKFIEEIERAKHEVWEEQNRREERQDIWRAIHRLEERIEKLEGNDSDELNVRRVK